MAKQKPLTIIDDKTMRGIIAPAKTLTKKVLADLIDFIELSSPRSVKETKKLVAEANDNKKVDFPV